MRRRTPFVLVWLAATGCSVGPDFHRPAAPNDQGYLPGGQPSTEDAAGKAQWFDRSRDVGGAWWEMLQSPPLNAIVRGALAANPGLDSARASLRRTQDNLRAGYGVFFPQLDGSGGASRQRTNMAPGVLPSGTYNLFTASATVSYTIDIWGGGRRQIEILAAAVDAQRYTLAAAYVMLTANIVDTVIAQAAYGTEIDETRATLVLLRDQVRIAAVQAEGGTAPYSNVLALESQLASTNATLPPLEQKIDQAANLLAALSGLTPANWPGAPVALTDLALPQNLPLSLPSVLVRQRPDVLLAEATLHAANAGIGVATAAMLPNITLSAGYGVASTGGSWSPLWDLAAGLTQPLFHGGTLYYQRKAAVDARDAAAADYRTTVLGAFQQVADALRGLGHDADAVSAQTEAVDTSSRALHLLQVNYKAGIVTYLQVLVADIQYQQAKIGYVQAVAQRLQDTVALYAALGGGWWNVPEVSRQ